MFVTVNRVPKAIELNPFRIFGVYANSPKKDIIANKGRAIAFLNVNRTIDFPLDLNGILSPIARTIEILNKAEGSLAIAKDQIKAAQFWFLKITPLDDIAFNYLVAGDIQRAKEIWSKQEFLSSLQNKIVCYLIENKPWQAVKVAEKLYYKYGDDYINKVDASCTLKMKGQELLFQFLDILGSEIGMQELLGYDFNETTNSFIQSQARNPLINKILSEIEKTKRVNHKDAKARIEAARNLVRQTKDSFATLKSIMKASDPQFQMIADKLGLEILQCGIDFFNNSNDDDRHQTAMKMQKYASSLVVGSLAKQRCEENIKILQKMIDELPPREVSIYEQYIQNKLSRFIVNASPKLLRIADEELDRIKKLLIDCGPYLGSIKEILGDNHPYYLKISTNIVSIVLSNVIDVVNYSLGKVEQSFGYNRNSVIEQTREAIKKAWMLTLLMDKFDIEPSFNRERYMPNRKILKDIVSQANVYAGKPNPVDMRSEKQMLSEIKTISDCEHFISVFPNSVYKKDVDEKKRVIRFNTCNSLKDCQDLEKNYPNRKVEIDKLKDKIIYGELERCKSLGEYDSFINNYPNSKYVNEAKERRDSLARSQKRMKILTTTIWVFSSLFIAGLIVFLYWDSNQKRELAEQIAKQAEYNMYDKIVNRGDSLSCDDFINKYPNSKYVNQVKLIKEEYEFRHLSTIGDCIEFQSNYAHSQYASSVDSIIEKEVKEMRKKLVNNNINFDSATAFISKYGNVPISSIQSLVTDVRNICSQILKEKQEKADKLRQDSIRKEEEAKKRAEYEKYGTDANAWKTASSANTIAAYRDYINRYPRGKHVEAANKKMIDLEVQSIINSGDYGYLPSSQKVSYGTGRYSTINISSRCNQTITIMYSGVKSMKIILSPYQSRKVVLPSATYKVVATSPGVRSFYGTENLTGGDYECEYYIETRRY